MARTLIQYGKNWTVQRGLALERDGGKCRVCGKKPDGWNNDVHHIIPVHKFNGDYIAANDLGNLITLCRYHHNQIEMGWMPLPVEGSQS